MNPLINIEIYIWDKNAFIKHEYHNNDIYIYQDDKCDHVLSKIKKIYNIKSNIYGWKNDLTPMDFYIENPEWKGYHINPLKYNKEKNIPRNENIIYKKTNSILNTNKIYIIKIDDIDKKIQKYYNIDRDIPIENEKLIKKIYEQEPAIEGSQYISKYNLYDKLKEIV
jgi:hypothetical protein